MSCSDSHVVRRPVRCERVRVDKLPRLSCGGEQRLVLVAVVKALGKRNIRHRAREVLETLVAIKHVGCSRGETTDPHGAVKGYRFAQCSNIWFLGQVDVKRRAQGRTREPVEAPYRETIRDILWWWAARCVKHGRCGAQRVSKCRWSRRAARATSAAQARECSRRGNVARAREECSVVGEGIQWARERSV